MTIMIRLLARLVLNLLSNAIGLAAAAVLLSGFGINLQSFIMAVFIFTASTALLGPFITSVALKNANYLMGGIALITTFVGLVITNATTNGLTIDGPSTWIIGTLVIWIFSVIGSVILPIFLFKKTLQKIKAN